MAQGDGPRQYFDRLASLGRVAADVGHEINNPLAFVQLNVSLAHERLPALRKKVGFDFDQDLGAIRELLDDAALGLERIARIVATLQTVSREPDEKWESVDLQAALDESIAVARNQIRHRARIVRQYGPHNTVKGNAGALAQVFLNLLVNASQAIAPGSADRNEIRVSTFWDGTNVLVEIRDTGQGIAADVLPHIFDPFFTTKDASAATGLGLAISRRIIADHSGTLTVSSDVGRGTVCKISLPASEATRAPVGKPQEEAPGQARAVVAPVGRILVIDDEPLIGRVVTKVLGRHEVVAVMSGQHAFDLLEEGLSFDLILCDLAMPNVGGAEVHDTLSARWPALVPRLVLMTGGASSPEARTFLERVRCPIIHKPFGARELTDVVTRHLVHSA